MKTLRAINEIERIRAFKKMYSRFKKTNSKTIVDVTPLLHLFAALNAPVDKNE